MSRFCVAWSNHNWVRGELAPDRHCSKCGLIEPRPHNRPDPDVCAHLWEHGTFRRRCQNCGKVDKNTVLAPRRVPAPPLQRSQVWRSKVRMCWARDGEGCFYCRCALSIEDARLDHFIPRSKGGPDSLANRRASCRDCDMSKRDKLPWEFMPERFEVPETLDDKCVDTASGAA